MMTGALQQFVVMDCLAQLQLPGQGYSLTHAHPSRITRCLLCDEEPPDAGWIYHRLG